MRSAGVTMDNVVFGRERVLFVILATISVLLYAGLIYWLLTDPAGAAVIVVYGLVFAGIGFLVRAFSLGHVRGNGVLVTRRQFPLVHEITAAHAKTLGMDEAPAVYVLESGGILNAFAARFVGARFVVLYADVLAMAVRQGRGAVSFVIGHELGHHWRGHLVWWWLVGPARWIPYLGSAYSRACEYTCDRVGAMCEPEGAIDGLAVLASGGWLHRYLDVAEFARQSETDNGFWIRRAEFVSSHPRLPHRVAALLQLGVPGRAAAPLVPEDAPA